MSYTVQYHDGKWRLYRQIDGQYLGAFETVEEMAREMDYDLTACFNSPYYQASILTTTQE